MAFVLDASVSACWAFTDEDHPVAGQIIGSDPDAMAKPGSARNSGRRIRKNRVFCSAVA